MANIIGVIQVKGGCGRSTIATNLAAILAADKPTLLIDCDLPQGTSSSWHAARIAEGLSGKLSIVKAHNHLELVNLVQAADGHEYVIIDAPPRIAEITKAILILSNLNLVPLAPSVAEIWATTDLLETIKAARHHKPDLDVRVIWNRFRAQTRSAKSLSEAVKEQLGISELKTRLGYRVSYADCLGLGLSVQEWTDKTARDEMAALVTEVKTILKKRGK